MPLNVQEIPTDILVDELARRYPHCMIAGCNDLFAGDKGETSTDLISINGNILMNLGLLTIVKAQLEEAWMLGKLEPEDMP